MKATKRSFYGVIAVLALGSAVLAQGAAHATVPGFGDTVVVSATPTGASADGDSTESSISADARYVVFTSHAKNLLPDNKPINDQVYRKDLVTGEVRLVSAVTGSENIPGSGPSAHGSISADGRLVAFASWAGNLQALPTGSGQWNVYVRDMGSNITRLISVASSGMRAGNGESSDPAISSDGSTVAFVSKATDLISTSTVPSTRSFVYRAPAEADATSRVELVSVADGSTAEHPILLDALADEPSVSADGSVIAFTTAASNARPRGNPAGATQVYVRIGSSTRLVSESRNGGGVGGNGGSWMPSLSGDGSTIAYLTAATDIVDTPGTGRNEQVMVRNLRESSSTLVSVNRSGTSAANDRSDWPALSADGSIVTFTSWATDLVESDTRGMAQVYARSARGVSLVSVDRTTGAAGSAWSWDSAISADGRVVVLTSDAVLSASPGSIWSTIYAVGAEVPTIERVAGVDRFETSASISARAFSAGVDTVYVASGAVYADALAVSATAGPQFAPVLLTPRDSIPPAAASELGRLRPGKIVVVGGVNSVSDAVLKGLESYAPSVSRIGGADRYEVAVNISKSIFGSGGIAVTYIASGENFADALSGSAAAGSRGGPVLLVTKNSAPDSVLAELRRTQPEKIVVLGGPNTIADSVVDAVKTIAPTERIAGSDRFATSAAIASNAFPSKSKTVYVASGNTFPDALSGAAAAITQQAPVLLVGPDTVPSTVALELQRLDPTRIIVLGGTSSISRDVEGALRQYVIG
ncbi:cell wall-binding repeat-containing protein [Herbiconiux sp. A18JL235]|uniref:Cell wall-binding repeat-containing protein n=1 Tax=Herbiconiux sp. A18JL235 TaxID=3152363 RepID=A0AB39BHQ3_9MICO